MMVQLRKRPAFSLVELLIVIGIVAALLAILLPSLTRAREMARRVVCLSNVRQLTIAWLAYANDNQGRFCDPASTPPTALAFDNRGGFLLDSRFMWSWAGNIDDRDRIHHGKLWPYLRVDAVYLCPDDWDHSRRASSNSQGFSYGINGLLGDGVSGGGIMYRTNMPGLNKLLKLSQIRRAERTFCFCEMSLLFRSEFQTPTFPLMQAMSEFTEPGRFHNRSDGWPQGTTISFADGHAIFWQYAVAPVSIRKRSWAQEWVVADGPNILQLASWAEGTNLPAGQ
jgi:prepilin-type N-terminal cleavage/methylation domain-containing protein